VSRATKHISVSDLRQFNKQLLRDFDKQQAIATIHEGAQPIAVMISYDLFMKWQEIRLQAERHAEKGKVGR
jgi:hypothetical protein